MAALNHTGSERVEAMAKYHVGVDVGGTKMLAAVQDSDGKLVARAKTSTPADSSEALMAALIAVIHKAVVKAGIPLRSVRAIGLGIPGVVGARGECIWAPNCPLSGVPVADQLAAEFDVPVAVGNDVNVGTLGEKEFGAAREFDSVFGMFVGTGIGGGLIVNGELVAGEHALGAEVGHILIDFEAARRGDDGGGEFEYYASRLGIERMLREGLAAGRESVIADQLDGDDERIKSGLLSSALEAGDELVTEVMAWACDVIGIGTVTVIHICDPEAIIYGGGVVEACAEFMLPRIEAAIAKHVAPGNGKPIRIVPSELGDDAVLLGAIALAKRIRKETRYPYIGVPDFGEVTVDDETLDYDIVVRANGTVKRRKKKLSREVHGTSHELSEAEVQWVCRKRTDRLIIGAGHHGQVTLSREATKWLKAMGIAVELLPTPEAAQAFNNTSGPKALLLHVSC